MSVSETGPADRSFAVTQSDTADLPHGNCRALYVGVTGDVKINDAFGNTVVFKAAPVGVLPVKASRVWDNGTDATDIVALY